MKRNKHFHWRSWDGHFYGYYYLGPVRLTVFNSSWLKGSKWLILFVFGLTTFAVLHLDSLGRAFTWVIDYVIWLLNNPS